MTDSPDLKPLLSFPGYFSSPDGAVYSTRQGKLRRLSPGTDRRGYRFVVLRDRRGRWRYQRIHRLCYMAHRRRLRRGEVVRHLDNNPANNAITNLRAGSQRTNMLQACREGRFGRKLDHARVARMRRLARRKSRKELAAEFQVSVATVGDVLARRTWRHCPARAARGSASPGLAAAA
jgi:hypothetical protein